MQRKPRMASVIIGLCLAASFHGGAARALSASSRAATQSQATAWLRAHKNPPQQDELAELRTDNPSAYALVKALLTKRSLGLLDPKHPSPSFAAPAQAAPVDPVPQGPAAFEAIAEESGEKPKAQVNLAYPDVDAAPAHHDWLSWKPTQSAVDDDAMVKNVLGAVAELKAGKGSSANLRGQAHPDSDSEGGDALQWKDNSAAVAAMPVAQVAHAAPVVAEAQPSQGNAYLNGLNLGNDLAPAQMAAPIHPAKLGLSTAKQTTDSHDYMASFSWDDDAPAAKAAPKAAPQQAAAASAPAAAGRGEAAKASTGSGGNALLAWLGGSAPVVKAAPKQAKAAAPAQSNYLMDLQ